MNDSTPLLTDRRGPVAHVSLNRPDLRNAFDDDLIARLTDAAAELGADDSVRVVVLRGEGKVFCAGADLNWMKRMVDYSEEENVRDSVALAAMYDAWDTIPKPVIGRIHGAAIGGGTGLVSVCDIAVAPEDAVFAFSEVRLGILPAVISPFVLRRIGHTAARELFLTGERFSADRALDIGLLNWVVDPVDLDDAVDAAVANLLQGGPEAQGAIKRLVADVAGLSPAAARDRTTRAIAAARVGAEGQEGMRAFLERRKASWTEES